MTHRNPGIECGKRRGCACRCVAMHEHHIRMCGIKHATHSREHPRCNVVQILTGLHDVEVVVGFDTEQVENLIKHLPMLSCHGHHSFKILRPACKTTHKRCHLYGFGACSENQHYFYRSGRGCCHFRFRVEGDKNQNCLVASHQANFTYLMFLVIRFGWRTRR